MVSNETQAEIEETLGQVPSFMEAMAEPAADHGWGLMRDVELGETSLSPREKALVGVGVASAMQCEYCVHFHTEEAKLDGASDEQITEAATLAAATRYFSTALHGAQVDHDEFVDETAAIVDHIERAQAEVGAD